MSVKACSGKSPKQLDKSTFSTLCSSPPVRHFSNIIPSLEWPSSHKLCTSSQPSSSSSSVSCHQKPKTSPLAVFCSPCHFNSRFLFVPCDQRSWSELTLSMDSANVSTQHNERKGGSNWRVFISPAPSLVVSWLASVPKLHGLAVFLNWRPQHLLSSLLFSQMTFSVPEISVSPYSMKPGSIMTSNISHHLVSLHLLTYW